jgi:hypothetical protein
MTDHRDVVAAFLDHEPVEAPALERALADPQGREYFMDLLVLRGLVAGAAVRVVIDGAGGLQPAGSKAHNRSGRRSAFWLAAAAALVAVGTTGGYLAGRVVDRQHEIPKVEQGAGAPAAPAPTHVIRLENGVTWNEKSGGN